MYHKNISCLKDLQIYSLKMVSTIQTTDYKIILYHVSFHIKINLSPLHLYIISSRDASDMLTYICVFTIISIILLILTWCYCSRTGWVQFTCYIFFWCGNKLSICFSLTGVLIFWCTAHHEYTENCIMLTYVYIQQTSLQKI